MHKNIILVWTSVGQLFCQLGGHISRPIRSELGFGESAFYENSKRRLVTLPVHTSDHGTQTQMSGGGELENCEEATAKKMMTATKTM